MPPIETGPSREGVSPIGKVGVPYREGVGASAPYRGGVWGGPSQQPPVAAPGPCVSAWEPAVWGDVKGGCAGVRLALGWAVEGRPPRGCGAGCGPLASAESPRGAGPLPRVGAGTLQRVAWTCRGCRGRGLFPLLGCARAPWALDPAGSILEGLAAVLGLRRMPRLGRGRDFAPRRAARTGRRCPPLQQGHGLRCHLLITAFDGAASRGPPAFPGEVRGRCEG